LISKSEIIVKSESVKMASIEKYKQPLPNPSVSMELTVSTTPAPLAAPSKATTTTKFLRPSSLPLKPGTFTPKQHHGITPTANTLPLISPETPRPSKSCVQLYLNGHAYTYLGLKCSTKTFYCTVNKPQPVYVPNQHKLSMYSNWQVYSENNPHPLGLKPDVVMALYDSRQRPLQYVTAGAKSDQCLTVNSQTILCTAQEMATFGGSTGNVILNSSSNPPLSASVVLPAHSQGGMQVTSAKGCDDGKNEMNSSATTTPISGGFENNDEYIYVRGRGRGKYVCKECGIRCKKPSMLKKHIRTHTDVRPYTCQHCSFR
jgi:human immunodeficiency virus type I enhancer-binding protein